MTLRNITIDILLRVPSKHIKRVFNYSPGIMYQVGIEGRFLFKLFFVEEIFHIVYPAAPNVFGGVSPWVLIRLHCWLAGSYVNNSSVGKKLLAFLGNVFGPWGSCEYYCCRLKNITQKWMSHLRGMFCHSSPDPQLVFVAEGQVATPPPCQITKRKHVVSWSQEDSPVICKQLSR